jgi:soluble lytic murein transglycosylase-like protein
MTLAPLRKAFRAGRVIVATLVVVASVACPGASAAGEASPAEAAAPARDVSPIADPASSPPVRTDADQLAPPPRADKSSIASHASVAAGGPLAYRAMIEQEANLVGLPPEIAEAVMGVESGYDPSRIGASGEIGLMQVLPSTARGMGFSGTLAELAEPAINIHYGVTYLGEAWRLAGEDLCTTVMKYRAGHGETRFSYRSVDYCLNVRARLAARGYRVTGAVPVATFGEPSIRDGVAVACRRRCLGGSLAGGVNLAALNSELSSLVVQARRDH